MDDRTNRLREYWPKLPHSLQRALYGNTSRAITAATRERNRCYMMGMAAAYLECGKLEYEVYSFTLSLINAEHLAATVRELWQAT